jgi:hypothetical protein
VTTFDPFTATMEEALAQPDALALTRWGNAQRLTAGRERFETNPLEGVQVCAEHGLVMPEWLAAAYSSGYRKAMCGDADSWDECFGSPHPKGTQLARLRVRERARTAVFRDIIDTIRLDPERVIDAWLFEEVGRRHGVGKTLAEELYREAVAAFGYGAAKLKRARNPATLRKLAGIRRRR